MSNIAAKAFRRAKLKIQNRLARINHQPLIFLGKGKSGTTAIAALFAEATGKSVALDIPALFIDGIRPILLGRSDLSEVVGRERLAFSHDIIKQPTLTWFFDELCECFPAAKFVMIVRDPRDNIRSVLNRMAVPGDLNDLSPAMIRNIHGGWRWHFDEPWLLDLKGANYIELSANRWNLATDVYRTHSDRMLLVRYEDFMLDKVGSIGKLAKQLGLLVIKDIAANSERQFQPQGKDRGKSWSEFFGPRNLAIIERVCGSRMVEFNYPSSAAAELSSSR
ncbi:MAG: sulfotransferase [Sphingomicrobium sp.]